ncbi:MAG: hypothetical protein ABSA59_02635 [Terriglobia bacterium]|jgi:hypothetical protein
MDKQDGQGRELKHAPITKGVFGCAFEVINELGAGFPEMEVGSEETLRAVPGKQAASNRARGPA